jgi:hypothetical protein
MRRKAMIKDKEKYIHSIMYDDELIYILEMDDINYAIKTIAKVLYYDEDFSCLTTKDTKCILLTDDGLEQLEDILEDNRKNAKI